jgi:hypothetical protein
MHQRSKKQAQLLISTNVIVTVSIIPTSEFFSFHTSCLLSHAQMPGIYVTDELGPDAALGCVMLCSEEEDALGKA